MYAAYLILELLFKENWQGLQQELQAFPSAIKYLISPFFFLQKKSLENLFESGKYFFC